MPYEELLPFATRRQREYIEAINAAGSHRKAAKAIGVSSQAIDESIMHLKRKAAIRGVAPDNDMTHAAPAPFLVKGVSTYYDEDGKVRGQWVKTKVDDKQAEEAIRGIIAELAEDIRGKAPAIPAPKHAEKDLLCVYPIGDPHFGMYAWAPESGEDFDCEAAEALIYGAMDRLVETAPASEVALILELGDLLHADNNQNRTMRSNNALDVDTRHSRVMQIAIHSLIHIIKRALEKHRIVKVRLNRGNHDDQSSFAAALVLDAYFHNEKRVEIDLSPASFWYFRFGKVLIGSTHGDTTKMQDLPGIMAADRPEDWGLTTHRYWYQGHVHHHDSKEYRGAIVEAFRTLAAKDAWHASEGYRSGRDMCLIVHHKDHGEIERHRCDVGMLIPKLGAIGPEVGMHV